MRNAPILFEKDETTFASNGICRLYEAISVVVSEERNGLFECDLQYPVTGANFEKIQCGRIIYTTHDDTGIPQPFDIVSYSKPINGVVTFHAVHVSYRTSGIVAKAQNINSLDDAFRAMVETAQPSSEMQFTFNADFTSTGYMAAFDNIPRSIRQLLGGIDGSVLDTYGGEYEFDKFNITLHRARGVMRDFRIRYGVNMLDFTDDTDYQGIYTSCIPYWKGADSTGAETIVYGNRVDSGVSSYSGRNVCSVLDLSDKFEEPPTTAQLESMARTYMTAQQTFMPHQSIKVDFVRLQDMGYEGLENLLQCNLCDTITVEFPDYSMNGQFKIVKTVWDALGERYTAMELGTLSTSLADALGISNSLGGSGGGASGDDLNVRGDLAVGGDAAVVGTITVGGNTINDVVIETGGTGLNTQWHYRKWASGCVECWCRKEYSGVAITQTYGSVRYASLASFNDYPVAFAVYPVVNVSGSVTNGNGWVAQNNSNFSVNNPGGMVVYAPANISSANITVNVYAIGRWK